MKNALLSVIAVLCLAGCSSSPVASGKAHPHASAAGGCEVVAIDDVEWAPLNPARGDASPQAGDLWGDRTEEGATGFLVRFAEGFSSPPHIHNVTYRGVVIQGLVHNDDPNAAPLWMPVGSFWTQPAGEAHITAADAPVNMAYIEIGGGPYLVQPTDDAFDTGERPINVHASNLVWADAPGGAEVSNLWEDAEDGSRGAFVKLPAGFAGELMSGGGGFRGVVIQGVIEMAASSGRDGTTLQPGGYFGSEAAETYRVRPAGQEAGILYVRTTGDLVIGPAHAAR